MPLNYLLSKNVKYASIDLKLLEEIIKRVEFSELRSGVRIWYGGKAKLISYVYNQHKEGIKFTYKTIDELIKVF